MVLDAIPTRTIQLIPVLGFATLTKFDMAQRLIDSIDYPVEHIFRGKVTAYTVDQTLRSGFD